MVSFKIALRFLKSSKMQTLLIMMGLAVGIAVQIFVGQLLTNLQEGFLEETTGNASHVTVFPAEDEIIIDNWESKVAGIQNIDGITAVSPAVDSPALIVKGSQSNSILVRGLDMTQAEAIYELAENTYEGDVPTNDTQVLVGKELATDLTLSVGDGLDIITPSQNTFTLWVSGIYDLGSAIVNERWIIVNIASAQSIYSLGDNITSIETQTTDIFTTDSTAEEVAAALGNSPITVNNWKDDNPDFFSALASQGASSYMIQTFVLLSVVIGIASILSITVVQKSRQIGILKAMGIKDSQASLIFLYQGLLLGIGGAIMGVLLGAILFYGFIQALSSSGDSIISSSFDINFLLLSGLIAVIASAMASLLPAIKSRKLDPIEVIRNG